MKSSSVGVLIMAYGSALSAEDGAIRDYLRHILQYYRQTDPTDTEVQDLKERYQATGGSPLYEITQRIVQGTQHALDLAFPQRFQTFTAMKHSPPFIEDVVAEMAGRGIRQAIAVALAPFRSRLSTEGYYRLALESDQGSEQSIRWSVVEDWSLHPLFLRLWKNRVSDALSLLGTAPMVIFTNHSLPERIREWNDPYPEVFAKTAETLARQCSLSKWTIAYQSEGGGNQSWLGPQLVDVLKSLKRDGHSDFLLAPIGFLMDHLEILYDLDVLAQAEADTMGINVTRTRMPNDDPLLRSLLVDMIREKSLGAGRDRY